jgi:hypothetical protein
MSSKCRNTGNLGERGGGGGGELVAPSLCSLNRQTLRNDMKMQVPATRDNRLKVVIAQ